MAEPPVESLPDADLLALCDAELDESRQEELGSLLAELREGELSASQRLRLDELMGGYRRGLVLKARAIKEAVGRGLRASLGSYGA